MAVVTHFIPEQEAQYIVQGGYSIDQIVQEISTSLLTKQFDNPATAVEMLEAIMYIINSNGFDTSLPAKIGQLKSDTERGAVTDTPLRKITHFSQAHMGKEPLPYIIANITEESDEAVKNAVEEFNAGLARLKGEVVYSADRLTSAAFSINKRK